MTSPREVVLCQYHYDPLDRLIGHALPDVLERQRFYCKSRLATEIQGAISCSIVQHGDQLLAQQQNENDALDTTLMVTDQQRSVLQTFKANHPPQPITYSPYGHRPIESGLLSLLGFNGERADPVTGCYLLGNGYRAFNPVLMRFNSPDSWSPFGKGGLNAYAYCEGEPVLGIDPTGHWKIPSIWKRLENFWGRTTRKPVNSTPTYKSGESMSFTTTTNTIEHSKEYIVPYKLYKNNDKDYDLKQNMQWHMERPGYVKANDVPIKKITTPGDLTYIKHPKKRNGTPGSSQLSFIFTQKKEMYISSTGHPYLSDITGNPALISAGIIDFMEANTFSISNASGHFLPHVDSLAPVKEHLESLGAKVKTVRHF